MTQPFGGTVAPAGIDLRLTRLGANLLFAVSDQSNMARSIQAVFS